MKVLQVFDCYGIPKARALPGGENGSVATVVYYLSKYLVKKGCDVTILERDLGFLPKEEYIDGIRYCRIPSKGLPAHPYKLIKTFRGATCLAYDSFAISKKINSFLKSDGSYDVVHFHFPFASSILLSFDRKLRKISVYTAHVGEENRRFGFSRDVPFSMRLFLPDLYLMKRVGVGVVLNDNLKQKLIKKGLKPAKLAVIPNGIVFEELSNCSPEKCRDVKDKYNVDSKVTLLFVGKIIPRKGVDVLLRAVSILAENGYNNFKVIIAGDTKLDSNYFRGLLSYVKTKNIENLVSFTGFVDYEELKALYSICDLFVFPSFEEGDPVALKEALALGKPLIGSNVSGIPMQIREGWNGFLFEPGNEKQLAERMAYLIENEEERDRMGENSRKLAEEEFSWSRITEKYLEVYNKILGE